MMLSLGTEARVLQVREQAGPGPQSPSRTRLSLKV